MPQPKQPTDHKSTDNADDVFAFTHKGKRYTFDRPTVEVITPGWLRRNRKTNDLDATYSAIEELADDDVLAVLDGMSFKEHFEVHEAFSAHVQELMGGVSLGESGGS